MSDTNDNNENVQNQDVNHQSAAEQAVSDVRREPGVIPDERRELVKQKTRDVKAARKFWDEDFKRMKRDQDFLLGIQWAGQTKIDDEDERYVINICQRHVQQRTAAVYAKNPTVVARRKEMLDFVLWDENPLTAQMAMQAVSQAGQLMAAAAGGDPAAQAQAAQSATNPQVMQEFKAAQALLADIQQGMALRAGKTRMARTMELYFKNKVLVQQNPPFKASMKQLVRRGMAAGIGYVKLGLVRDMELSPDVLKGMATLQEQMAEIEMLMADLADNPAMMADCTAEKEELRLALEAMQSSKKIVTQEGIIFDFPSPTSIIPDWKLVHLQGFVGCDFVAEEYMLTPDQIQKLWKVDVQGNCTVYDPENKATTEATSEPAKGRGTDGRMGKKGLACVWIIYDRTTGLVYTVCDGYPDFLEEPAEPPLKLERFFPWFALGFNYIEHHTQRFPLSDVHLLRHPQKEMNRAREGLREQRIANRPLTLNAAGTLSDTDKEKLQTRPANAVVQLDGLKPNQKAEDLIQPYKHPPIDPTLYDVTPAFEDVLRAVGSQEANLGGTSNSTATESSIAESSRMSSLQSNMDDMDDFLTEIMRAAGQAALMEIGPEEVKRVVGPGAMWPQLSGQDVADEIFLEIQAGSSGRPNKAVEVQNMTQMAPVLLQIPGLNPQWLARQMLTRLDDRLDLTEAFLQGQPSIQTLNALAAKPLGQGPAGAAKPGGPGAEDPNAQGGEGGQNTEGVGGAGGALGPQAGNAQPPAAQPVQM